MAVIETWFEQDLQKPVKVRYIDGNLFSHNGNGNRIGVVVTDNGEAVTLTGTVSGYAVLADGTTVPCTGSRSGNKASILVPAAAYSPGSILISIFLTDGSTVTTLAALSSSVIMARTNNQIDPGSVVTDWTNTINAAMQSVETAAANLGNIVATPYANLTFPVPLGAYTIYNNSLYRCISPIPSSEAWTAAHWTDVKLGDDVADLKSEINKNFQFNVGAYDIKDKATWENGIINDDGSQSVLTDSKRTNQIPVINGNYTIVYSKSASTGWIRVHGYKNGSWVRLIYKDNSSGTDLTYSFTVDNTIDAIALSVYKNVTVLLIIEGSTVIQRFSGVNGAISDANNNISRIDNLLSAANNIGINNAYKFAKEKKEDILIPVSVERGTLDSGIPIPSVRAFRTKEFVPVNGIEYMTIRNFPSNVKIYLDYYDENCDFISETSTGITDDYYYIPVSGVYYVKAVFAPNPSSTDITIEDCQKVLFTYGERRPVNEFVLNAKMEHGRITAGLTTVSYTDFFSYERTAYLIKTNGASHLYIDSVAQYAIGNEIIVYKYDASFVYIGYVDNIPIGGGRVDISNCAYIKLRFAYSTFTESIRLTFYGCSEIPKEIKNVRIERADPFEFLTFKITKTSCGTERLFLPPNYSPTGDKVPLILYMPGSKNFSVWAGGPPSGMYSNYQYLCDEGFAILFVFGWPDTFVRKYPNCGYDHPYPTPSCLATLKAGIEYACDRYNIDADNVHIMSKSQGGQCATYFATYPIWNFKSIGMFAPVCDFISMPGGDSSFADRNKALADDMGFTGDVEYYTSGDFTLLNEDGVAFYQANILKLAGMNEAWTSLVSGTLQQNFDASIDNCLKFWNGDTSNPDTSRTDIYNDYTAKKIGKVPVKIWGAADDNKTPYRKMVEVIKQLQNGGCEADIVTFANHTGGHDAADAGTNKIASVTTALGITHTNVPTGFVENVQWIRQHMVKDGGTVTIINT